MYILFPRLKEKGTAGFMLFAGTLTVLFGIMFAEFTYPGYSVSLNYISDLGAHAEVPAAFFNITIVIFGLCAIYAGFLLRSCLDRTIGTLVIIAGAGAVIVGVFNEHTIIEIHYTGAFLAFFFGALAILLSAKRVFKSPMSYVFWVLGGMSLFFLIVFGMNMASTEKNYLGLGVGGIERLVAYPILFWALALGAYLVAVVMMERAEIITK
jgi:hypothetical membrane protein